jgi:hypothetical protein
MTQRFERESLILLLRRQRESGRHSAFNGGGKNPAAPFLVDNSDPIIRRVGCMSGKRRTRNLKNGETLAGYCRC